MEKSLSKIFSFVFHPLIIPIAGTTIIFYYTATAFYVPFELQKKLFILVFLATFLMPSSMIPVFKTLRVISNYQMENSRERIFPLIFVSIPYLFVYLSIIKLPFVLPSILKVFIFAGFITVIVTAAISYFWKISIHAIGMGSLSGLLFALSYYYNVDIILLLIIFLLMSGFVLSSRLYLNSHNESQVYSGFALGLVIMTGMAFLF